PKRVNSGQYGLCVLALTQPVWAAIDSSDDGIQSGVEIGPADDVIGMSTKGTGFTVLKLIDSDTALVQKNLLSDPGSGVFITTNGPDSTPYPKMSEQPNVYFANKMSDFRFPNAVGQQPISSRDRDTKNPFYLFCDFTYLYQGTIVLANKGVVTSILSGA